MLSVAFYHAALIPPLSEAGATAMIPMADAGQRGFVRTAFAALIDLLNPTVAAAQAAAAAAAAGNSTSKCTG
jgi:hypothetical protein